MTRSLQRHQSFVYSYFKVKAYFGIVHLSTQVMIVTKVRVGRVLTVNHLSGEAGGDI